MLVVGENLLGLIKQENICPLSNYDNTCISLTLGNEAIYLIPSKKGDILEYGETMPKDNVSKVDIVDDIIIEPHSGFLASSDEIINMPIGYFGFLQTKGSLARLLVAIQCSDGQVDPGYKGKITFEIINNSDFRIKLKRKQVVGNLYIFKTSTNDNSPYEGKYNKAEGPTVFRKE